MLSNFANSLSKSGGISSPDSENNTLFSPLKTFGISNAGEPLIIPSTPGVAWAIGSPLTWLESYTTGSSSGVIIASSVSTRNSFSPVVLISRIASKPCVHQ